MKYLVPALVALALFGAVGPVSAQTSAAELEKKVAELEAELARVAAETPTLASAVADVSARLERLEEQIETLRREQRSVPQAIAELDALGERVGALAVELEELRTRLADLEMPVEAAPGGGGVAWRPGAGFTWQTAGGDLGLFLGGLMQFQIESTLNENARGNFTEEASTGGYQFRRTRIYLGAEMGPLRTWILADPRLDESLLEYKVELGELKLASWVEVGSTIGQFRAPFTRQFITWAPDYVFIERPQAVENLRYDRSPGLAVHAKFLDDRLFLQIASTNGTGPNSINDNREFASFVRVEGSVFGPRPAYGYGDVEHSEDPVLVLGAGFGHELAQVPVTISGIEVGERDVDGDGEIDNLRILSASADLLFRFRGFELAAEGIFRREDWGTVFDHPDNLTVGELFEFDGGRNYIGLYGDVSYAWKDWIFGGRFGHHRQAPLQTDDREREAPPPSFRQLEAAATVRMRLPAYHQRFFGLTYRYLNDNNDEAAEIPNDESHQVSVSFQLQF